MSRFSIRQLGLLISILLVSLVLIPIASAENLYSVIEIKNTTDITIRYRVRWGATSEWAKEMTLAPGEWNYHNYKYDKPDEDAAPKPEIKFATGIGKARKEQSYSLSHYASPDHNDGGKLYEFSKVKDDQGEEYLEFTSWPQEREQAFRLTKRGIALFAKGSSDDAIDLFTKSIKLYDADADAYNFRGLSYKLRGELTKAIADYTLAMSYAPKNATYPNNRAWARLAAGENDAALDDFKKALKLNPKYFNAISGKITVYMKRNEFELALQSSNEAIKLIPESADAYNARGLAQLKLTNYALAIEDFTLAIRFDPKHTAALNNRGAAYFLSGNYQLAIDNCTKAIQLDKSLSRAYWWRSQAHAKLGNDALAQADYTNAMQLDPSQERVFEKVRAYYSPASGLRRNEALLALQSFKPGSTLTSSKLRELNELATAEGLTKPVNPIPAAVRTMITSEQTKLSLQEFEMSAAIDRLLKAAVQTPEERQAWGAQFHWLLGPVTSPHARDTSRDDLGGLRLIGRLETKDGGEVHAIFPVRWYTPPRSEEDTNPSGLYLLWGGDNCRVEARLHKTGDVKTDYAYQSFSIDKKEGAYSIRPGLYVDPKTGVLINPYITSSALSTQCVECHSNGPNLTPQHLKLMREKNYTEMEGFKSFLEQAKHFGAKKTDLATLETQLKKDPGLLLPLAEFRKANEAFWVERFRDLPQGK